jgi:integrase
MQKTKSGRWQVRWRERGRHRAKTFRNKLAAKKFEVELEFGQADTMPKESGMTFKEYAYLWHEDYCKTEKSESQWAGDLGIINNHLIEEFGDVPLKELDLPDMLKLRSSLRKKGLSAKTINNITSLAHSILTRAVKMKLIGSNPFSGEDPLKVPPQPFGYWTLEERDRFLSYCKREDPTLWEVVVMACHTGMRLGEIQALTRNALDFERRTILVYQSFDHKLRKVLPYTKGKSIRQIPMNQAVFEILKERILIAPTDRVFKRNLRHASRRMKTIIAQAGVKEIRFHDLRHTFASTLAMAKASTQDIQALLGHVDIKETMRYSHLHPDSLKGVTDRLVRDLCVTENREEKRLISNGT